MGPSPYHSISLARTTFDAPLVMERRFISLLKRSLLRPPATSARKRTSLQRSNVVTMTFRVAVFTGLILLCLVGFATSQTAQAGAASPVYTGIIVDCSGSQRL